MEILWYFGMIMNRYECNLFLESAEFPGEVSKTKVRFGGEHEEKKIDETRWYKHRCYWRKWFGLIQ